MYRKERKIDDSIAIYTIKDQRIFTILIAMLKVQRIRIGCQISARIRSIDFGITFPVFMHVAGRALPMAVISQNWRITRKMVPIKK